MPCRRSNGRPAPPSLPGGTGRHAGTTGAAGAAGATHRAPAFRCHGRARNAVRGGFRPARAALGQGDQPGRTGAAGRQDHAVVPRPRLSAVVRAGPEPELRQRAGGRHRGRRLYRHGAHRRRYRQRPGPAGIVGRAAQAGETAEAGHAGARAEPDADRAGREVHAFAGPAAARRRRHRTGAGRLASAGQPDRRRGRPGHRHATPGERRHQQPHAAGRAGQADGVDTVQYRRRQIRVRRDPRAAGQRRPGRQGGRLSL